MNRQFFFCIAALLVCSSALRAADAPTDAEIQGRALAADLVAERPAEGFVQTGLLRVRDSRKRKTEMPIRCEVIVTPTNWRSAYEAVIVSTNGITNAVRFEVVHAAGQPNQHRLASLAPGRETPRASLADLSPDQTMAPFAGSDFWLADLGLLFFHWPSQRILKSEMRSSRSCKVLESVNPQVTPGSYRRVVSWIDNETGGIVQAEAYDEHNKLLKEFEPKHFKKVNGRWEVKQMRIDNVQTDSQTVIEFDLGGK